MKVRPFIKICGLTRPQDIECLNKYLPEYAGFVFARSKRQVTPEQGADLVKRLDPRIQSVGVFVNSSLAEVIQIAKQVKLDILQLHGSESPQLLQALRLELPHLQFWKAHRVTGLEQDGSFMAPFPADAHLVDAFSNASTGGGGQPFNWSAAHYLQQTPYPLILAGGLTAENVGTAIESFKPYAVDVSSGVETGGFKDPDKIRRFIEVVRQLQ